MKRSYAELDSMKQEVDRQQQLQEVQESVKALKELHCHVCTPDIDQYYSCAARIAYLQASMKVAAPTPSALSVYSSTSSSSSSSSSLPPLQQSLMKHAHVQKALSPGRVVVLFTERYQYCLAVILQRKGQGVYTVLMLCNPGDDSEDAASSLVSLNLNIVRPHEPVRELFRPEGEVRHTVVEIRGQQLLVSLTTRELTVEASRIVGDYKQRQIPRFQ